MDISRNNFIYVLFLQLEYKSRLHDSNNNNNKQTNNKQKQKKESYIIKKYQPQPKQVDQQDHLTQRLIDWFSLHARIQTHKRFKRTLLIRTKHNMRIFGVISFFKLQNNTQTVKNAV